LPSVVNAAAFIVSNTNDSGPGSLRRAINRANNNTGADTIFFVSGVSGKIILTSGQLLIRDDLTITGPGAGVLAVSGNHSSRVMEVESDATVAISGLTVTEGTTSPDLAPEQQGGGGIRNFGSLTLTDTVVTGNRAQGYDGSNGGGILNHGFLTVDSSVISENGARRFGGGIFSSGFGAIGGPVETSVTLINTRVVRNSAGESAGGIHSNGPLIIKNSIIRLNGSSEDVGGIFSSDSLTVRGSIIGQNQGDLDAGGIEVFGNASIANSRIFGNRGFFGISYSADTSTDSLVVTNSVIRGNSGGGIFNTSGAVVLRNNTRVINNSGSGVRNVAFSGGSEPPPTLTVRSSTISGNAADTGGGIYNGSAEFGGVARNGNVRLVSSTITDNTAVRGGGVYNQGTLTLESSAITSNTATGGPGSGGGVFNEGGTVSLDFNSSISNNIPDDCVGC
jgi:hypothetical protein